jgi:hypothetical protein
MENMIDHPPHYNSALAKCTCGKTIECIDVTRHLNFNLGNVIKYIWRSDLKLDQLTDLKKAAWYLNDEIKKLEGKTVFDDPNIQKGELKIVDSANVIPIKKKRGRKKKVA